MKEQKVAIADDHPMVRRALKNAFQGHPYLRITGEANDGDELMELIDKSPTDIAIIDLEMPNRNGYDTILDCHTQYPGVKTIAFSGFLDSINQQRAINLGAFSTISKTESINDFVAAVEITASGQPFHSKVEKFRTISQIERSKSNLLTLREKQILHLIAEGKTSKQISEFYHISQWTVDKHRANIKEKLGIKTLAEMIRYALGSSEEMNK